MFRELSEELSVDRRPGPGRVERRDDGRVGTILRRCTHDHEAGSNDDGHDRGGEPPANALRQQDAHRNITFVWAPSIAARVADLVLDGVHPTAAGYAVMAPLVAASLMEVLPR